MTHLGTILDPIGHQIVTPNVTTKWHQFGGDSRAWAHAQENKKSRPRYRTNLRGDPRVCIARPRDIKWSGIRGAFNIGASSKYRVGPASVHRSEGPEGNVHFVMMLSSWECV